MRTRILAVIVAALTLTATVAVMAASQRFPDVGPGDPHYDDIEFVAERGYFQGRANGSFSPGAPIDATAMARVLERLPDEMTRAQFASFIVGGLQRMRRMSTTTTTQPTTTTTAAPVSSVWGGTCAALYEHIQRIAYNEYGYPEDYDFQPRRYEYDRDSESYNRFGVVRTDIIRVTGWYKRFVTSYVFMCQGDAKLDNGRKLPMIILARIDADGDRFYNYWFPGGGQPTCSQANRDGRTVNSYNIFYLYSKNRDSDQDRIMCEDVLPEDELQIVGDAPAGKVAL